MHFTNCIVDWSMENHRNKFWSPWRAGWAWKPLGSQLVRAQPLSTWWTTFLWSARRSTRLVPLCMEWTKVLSHMQALGISACELDLLLILSGMNGLREWGTHYQLDPLRRAHCWWFWSFASWLEEAQWCSRSPEDDPDCKGLGTCHHKVWFHGSPKAGGWWASGIEWAVLQEGVRWLALQPDRRMPHRYELGSSAGVSQDPLQTPEYHWQGSGSPNFPTKNGSLDIHMTIQCLEVRGLVLM